MPKMVPLVHQRFDTLPGPLVFMVNNVVNVRSLVVNPCLQQLLFSFNSIAPPLSSKQTIIDPNPPLVGQTIEIKEFLRENAVPFDES